jgi:DNA-binding CsgD family transcriptional regulator
MPSVGSESILTVAASLEKTITFNVSIRQERAFGEIKRLSSAGLEGTELLQRVARTLGRAIPFDAYCASTTDPATNLMTRGIAEGFIEDDAAGNVFFDCVYFEEDLDQTISMARRNRPVQLLSETTEGKLERSLRYRELLRPQGLGHELGGAFIDGGLWGGMDLMREMGSSDFTAREVAFMKRIAPHVGAGLRTAALYSHAVTDQDTPDLPGVLTLDRNGRILSQTPPALRWLEDLKDLHPAWRENDPPIPVRMVAGTLQRSLSPASGDDANFVPRVRVRGRSGRWITLHGSLTEPADGRPSETVVVIEPARAQDVAWLKAAAYGLSPREDEIVKLVARGFSTRRISQTLYISEYTVQRHLQNVFEKVGVKSRRELVKRLFFENLLPGMITE